VAALLLFDRLKNEGGSGRRAEALPADVETSRRQRSLITARGEHDETGRAVGRTTLPELCRAEVEVPAPGVDRVVVEPRPVAFNPFAALVAIEVDVGLVRSRRRNVERYLIAERRAAVGRRSGDGHHDEAEGRFAVAIGGERCSGDDADDKRRDERSLDEGLNDVNRRPLDPHDLCDLRQAPGKRAPLKATLSGNPANWMNGLVQSRGFASPAHAGFALVGRRPRLQPDATFEAYLRSRPSGPRTSVTW